MSLDTSVPSQAAQTQQQPLTPEVLQSTMANLNNTFGAQANQQAAAVEKEFVELVVFNIANQEYAIPIFSVQEIILYQQPTRVPSAPPAIVGIINLRGRIIPVLNTYKRLGLEQANTNETFSKNGDTRIIIVQVMDQTVGLVVDAVNEVINLCKSDINQPPAQLSVSARFVTGIGKYNNRLLITLDPVKVIFDKDSDATPAK